MSEDVSNNSIALAPRSFIDLTRPPKISRTVRTHVKVCCRRDLLGSPKGGWRESKRLHIAVTLKKDPVNLVDCLFGTALKDLTFSMFCGLERFFHSKKIRHSKWENSEHQTTQQNFSANTLGSLGGRICHKIC